MICVIHLKVTPEKQIIQRRFYTFAPYKLQKYLQYQ